MSEAKSPGDILVEVLNDVVHATVEDSLPICIFDLDSTLFDNCHRNLRILREFVEQHWSRYPQVAQVAAEAKAADLGWNVMQYLQSRGFDDPQIIAEVERFWAQRFFTDEYVLSDGVTPGAAEFVTACHQRGALIYYLTGRHVGGMEVGTLKALLANDFPWGLGRIILHLKPRFDMADVDFKNDAFQQIARLGGPVVATFENEPANANLFRELWPEAKNFCLQTMASPDPAPLHPDVIRIDDFEGWK